MLGGRLIAAVAAAVAALPASAAAAPAPSSVLVQGRPSVVADALPATARPVLPAASVARLERRAGRPLPELRGLYRVSADGAAGARRTARRLDDLAGVEASVERAPTPPPAACRADPEGGWPAFSPAAATPDLSGFQDYRDGLEIPDAAAGAGVRIADVEYEWRRTHEDLASRALPAPVLTPGGLDELFQAEDHGTAVLGILAADEDGSGVTGLAVDADVRPLSPFPEADPSVYDLLGATLKAAQGLRKGDVLLIEQQTQVPTPSGSGYAPVEALPAMRDLIRAIVDAGIVVVEPAGNGDRDLASLNLPWLDDPADRGNSGALMVGAGNSAAAGTDLARVPGSNYGARVDVQGYGAGVLTSGYGQGLGPATPRDRAYTSCFDGTSSASATVAGAVATLQGLATAATGVPLDPDALRTLVVATGAPQADPAQGRIGPRPQVAAAASLLGPVEPPTGSLPQEPAPPPAVAPVAAPPPRAASIVRPAATRARARLDRRGGTLTITLRGLAPRAVVFVGGRNVRVRQGILVLFDVRPRRFVVVVSAPRGPRASYTLARFRVTIGARGPARVTRL